MSERLHLNLDPSQAIDLAHSFRCGQIFRWRDVAGTWVGALGPTALAITPVGDALEVRMEGPMLTEARLRSFLGLDVDLPSVVRAIATDEVLVRATEALPGLRILRQEPWECVVSFISSAWNNVPKIERSMGMVARRWGTVRSLALPSGVEEVACFPTAEALAAVDADALRECGLGYRAPLVAATARQVAEGGWDFDALRGRCYDDCLAAMRKLPGVGRKVADCILLYSLDQGEAFPIDVWVRRIMLEYYSAELRRFAAITGPGSVSGPSDREYRGIHAFAGARWGRWAGYAQQYLFHAKRLGIV